MAKSAQLVLQLLNQMLSAARPAAAEITSLGRLVAEILLIDSGKAREAAVYLMELGYSGAAVRLTDDVSQLRQKADGAFLGPFVAAPTPDDRKQERRKLEALHFDASRLLDFLNELKSLIGEDNGEVTAADQGETGGGKNSPKKRIVSARGERLIEQAIGALPSGSTQDAVAKEADVSDRMVRDSKAWKKRHLIWRTEKPTSVTYDDDPTKRLDVETFIRAKLPICHHKTRGKVERIMKDGDRYERLLDGLLDVNAEFESTGSSLFEQDDRTTVETIRSVAETVTQADKCPV